MKVKITVVLSCLLLSAFLVNPSFAGTVTQGQNCTSTSDCASGLACTPCTGQGATCTGSVCWPSSGTTIDPNNGIGVTNPPTGTSAGTIKIPATNLPDPAGGIKGILENFLRWVLGIFGILALISFIISGIQYFSSVGTDKGMETAKKNMTYSIIGVIIALSGFVIIKAIDTALRATSTVF